MFGSELPPSGRVRPLADLRPRQPICPEAVVHAEATAVNPLRDPPRAIVRQQAALHNDGQQLLAHPRLNCRDDVPTEPAGGMDNDPVRGGSVEHAVDDDAVEVQVGIEGGTEAVDERDRAVAGRGIVDPEDRRRTQVWLHESPCGTVERPFRFTD